MIGIIGAMSVEVNKLKEIIKNKETKTISGIEFIKGEICGKSVVVATCGIGKVNAAICTQTMILTYRVKMIINTGVAGGLAKGITVGDVVVATDVVQYDIDTSPLGDPYGLIPGINIVNVPCNERIVNALANACSKFSDNGLHNLHSGTIASGDRFISSNSDRDFIIKNFNASACEMEGGSIAHVCYINKVDFAILRAISDNANDDAHIDFNVFVQEAAEHSIKIMCEFLSNEV